MPKQICSYPSCKNISTNKSRCDLHQYAPKANTTGKTESRSSTTANNHIYQSVKWRKLRNRKAKSNPLCEHCLKYNVIKPLDVIDHIIEIEDQPELAYVYSNLQSLCHSCHNAKTAKYKADRKTKVISSNDLFNKIKNKGE